MLKAFGKKKYVCTSSTEPPYEQQPMHSGRISWAEFSCDNWAETYLSCTEFSLPQFSFGIIEPWANFAWHNLVFHNLALA